MFGFQVIELSHEFLVGFVESFILVDKLSQLMFEVFFDKRIFDII